MSEFVISSRYANALMSIGESNNSFNKIVEDLNFINNTLIDSKELRNLLKNPVVKSEKKLAILNDLFSAHISKDVNDFLKFLVQKGRENFLFDIGKRFLSLADIKLNQVKVNVVSAIELSETQKENIKIKLNEILNKKIIAQFEIDNSIIGGFK
ncbi:MAG: ATP synthase F1 subunit delta, partial [Ignavibacteriae bacterium]|nr:ATP synthase F1 subunit delta [Ignavibacteriota bacterium]